MRVFISVDMEGIAGVATNDQVIRGGTGYARAQQLMTAEANAAIQGAFDGGATEVVVNDSHGTMDNLLHADLDERARLVFGRPRGECMMHGVTADDAVALFIGYHAAAGAPGVLAHTVSGWFTEVRLDGHPVAEADLNALYAASHGVPVGLLTGDDEICAAATARLPGIRTVETKRACATHAADSVHPLRSVAAIRAAAATTVAAATGLSRPDPDDGHHLLEIDFMSPHMADHVELVPGAERLGVRTVALRPATAREVLGAVSTAATLATVGARSFGLLLQRG